MTQTVGGYVALYEACSLKLRGHRKIKRRQKCEKVG